MRFRRGQANQKNRHTSNTRSHDDDDASDGEILPLTTTERDLGTTSNHISTNRLYCSCSTHRRKRLSHIAFTTSLGIFVLLLQRLLQKLIPHDHSTFDDVFWRAVFLMPISYFRIHVFEDRHLRPAMPDYEYHLHNNNTFVINLDSDTLRWEQYQRINKIGSRFAAVDFNAWMIRKKNNSNNIETTASAATRIKDDHDDDDHDLQRLLRQYPNLANLVNAGRFGEAGVMASHLRVYAQILQRNLTYAFIFEDDVLFRLSENSTRSSSKSSSPDAIIIRAPHPADVIFLTSTILRATHIQIPANGVNDNDKEENHTAASIVIRVMGGSGTYGILVTQRGALKLLSLLQHGSCGYFDVFHDCRVDPLDIAIMKLAARHGLQMYTPFPARPVQFFHSKLGKTTSAKALRDSSHTNE
jgi:GR25 family glycosyltransferase involved in LPS biosynthesis